MDNYIRGPGSIIPPTTTAYTFPSLSSLITFDRVGTVVMAPAGAVVGNTVPHLGRAPAHDPREHHRPGGNFACSTAEALAVTEAIPHISTLTHPVNETTPPASHPATVSGGYLNHPPRCVKKLAAHRRVPCHTQAPIAGPSPGMMTSRTLLVLTAPNLPPPYPIILFQPTTPPTMHHPTRHANHSVREAGQS